jgi:antitoxin component YwqK of YwqJK toxin-antitoxin module
MKFIDYKSPEKAVINNTFNLLSYMDMWISSIIEGYIYEKVSKVYKYGYREEYMSRYGKEEGEYKIWHYNGKLERQCYYKEGNLEGECKEWYDDGYPKFQGYYKDGNLEGGWKKWNHFGEFSYG